MIIWHVLQRARLWQVLKILVYALYMPDGYNTPPTATNGLYSGSNEAGSEVWLRVAWMWQGGSKPGSKADP